MRSSTHSYAAVAGSFGGRGEAGTARVAAAIEAARGAGAELVVLPECALGGYLRPDGSHAPPIDLDGPEIARLREAAGDTVVCAGFTERGPGRPYSSAVCVSGDGVLGHQRKVHLPPSECEAFAPGDGFAAFDTPVGRVGMLLCYDKLFPEAARTLALDGAEAIASLSAWPLDRRDPARRIAADRQTRHFNLLDESRALENQVVWVSANLTGKIGPLRFIGQAKVVDPEGRVLARTGGRAGMAVAEVAPSAEVATARGWIDHLGDRAIEAYRTDRTAAPAPHPDLPSSPVPEPLADVPAPASPTPAPALA